MSTNSDILYNMRKALGIENVPNSHVEYATVNSVDKGARTCVVTTVSTSQPVELEGVRLMSQSGDGELKIPSVESTVIVVWGDNVQPYVTMFSDLDEILWITGKASINMKTGIVQFNDGSYGGIPVQKLILNNLNVIYDYVINGLVQTLQTSLNAAGGGDASAGTTFLSLMQSFRMDFKNMENKDVTHGKIKE